MNELRPSLTEAGYRERKQSRLVQLRYSAIWLVFLSIPAVLIAIYSEAGPIWDGIGYAAIAVFAIVYVIAFAVVPAHGLDGEFGDVPNPTRFVLVLLVLLALAGFMTPALQEAIIAILPFFAGYGLFLLPVRRGLIWAAVTMVLLVVILWVFDEGFDLGLLLGPLLSIGFVVIIRMMLEWNEIEKRANIELAAVRERDAVSRDVHDILGHTLTVVALKTQLARRTLREDPDRAENELDEVLQHTQAALDEVRSTVGRLRTPELAAQLASARIALDTKDIRLAIRGSVDTVAVAHRAVFAWAVREAVTNVVRHSEATRCTITLDQDSLVVSDDGIGMQRTEGNGLSGLRRRIQDSGGTLSLSPATEPGRLRHPGRHRDNATPGTSLEVSFL